MYGLIVPVFNEEKRLNIDYFLEISKIPSLELLFVDDGSTDSTPQILANFVSTKDNVRLLRLEENVGKSEAVRIGLNQLITDSRLQAVGFIDSDAAFGVEDVSNLIEHITGTNSPAFSWWWTSRMKLPQNNVKRSNIRHLIGRLISFFLGLGFKGLPYDTQSGLKFFSNNQHLAFFLREPFKTRWFFEIELLIRARDYFTMSEFIVVVPVLNWREVKGSKLKFRNCVSIGKELLYVKSIQFKYRLKYARI
jgi:glycosyltransferase involved in cell wall biosynthesis